ncbi:vacuolar protein-sorting-associated protein 37 homolog 1-like [Macadamia integrifolia]|uniref:vacuolar protein-sorting-associated protein 37 homolog 1-like n=1 Tax=Macadamia integrifolia TaxID=60698 RepID=UPI001C4E3D74|nr:vacuolar protein-sorting-associated protein 37 homolog 1-like [Macadamia integrifolia]
MFKSFWGSQEQQSQPHPQEAPTQAWYPPSLVGSPNSSRPSTPNSSFNGSNIQRPSDRPQSPSHVQLSPAEAASMIGLLKDKSVDELRKLLSDKDAYNQFLLSLDQVRTQNNLRDELRRETLQLTRENLEKQPRILELTNQCRIIRTTELATAKEKLNDLERQKEETLRYSPSMLLLRMQDATKKAEEESETLHQQLIEREIDISAFVQKYKRLRITYHRCVLTHLAAKTSSV